MLWNFLHKYLEIRFSGWDVFLFWEWRILPLFFSFAVEKKDFPQCIMLGVSELSPGRRCVFRQRVWWEIRWRLMVRVRGGAYISRLTCDILPFSHLTIHSFLASPLHIVFSHVADSVTRLSPAYVLATITTPRPVSFCNISVKTVIEKAVGMCSLQNSVEKSETINNEL